MADISTETSIITNGTRGEAVRDAFTDACMKLEDEMLPKTTVTDAGKVAKVVDGEIICTRLLYWNLESITVATHPTKNAYHAGETLDLTGLVVNATFSSDFEPDKTENVTADCVISPASGTVLSTVGTQTITIEYTSGWVTETATFTVTVGNVAPVSLAVTTQPTKTSYVQGETLNLTGLVLTATLTNGNTSVVTSSCTFSPANGTALSTTGTQTVTATYTSEGETVTTSFNVAVVGVSSIAVTTMPTKTSYIKDETLNLSGIVVTATYSNGNTAVVTNSCTFSPANGSTLSTVGTKSITVSYTYGGVTKTTSFNVSVIETPVLDDIMVTTSPNKTEYNYGDNLDLTGVVVKAYYTNGSDRVVTNSCTFSPSNGTTLNGNYVTTVQVIVSYTENGVTKTSQFYIYVLPDSFTEVPPTKTTYSRGETYDDTGHDMILHYGGSNVYMYNWIGDFRDKYNGRSFGTAGQQTLSRTYYLGSQPYTLSVTVTVT